MIFFTIHIIRLVGEINQIKYKNLFINHGMTLLFFINNQSNHCFTTSSESIIFCTICELSATLLRSKNAVFVAHGHNAVT